mmetsp:Transcript_24550/g.53643  ORF Transcript_24550/g.53643 Transcript_24550/m.53643 type:complete len:672 (+) Transcript_24550:240-2255(+)|eukprot:CAMPEP_0202911206 /NCGR_PEP_ID=MMETSP1392-20130828/54322_1 /ASSEMBLY_ACC=CAM_ASM_000868 /TAXON_ID=225041 /ORGANISM="Chlamydomonas chlamydogama, Strain SAG 11-48b" /LENGTH=671 /DNA_ID=CAMNT_0049601621 /DNA_START=146 /DNA_END=2161 /DNA_ORIENTATION=+
MSAPKDDPLQFGEHYEDMDDLTAQLESALHTYRPGRDSQDGYDLGDNTEFTGAGLDRYKLLDEGDDDPLAGPLGAAAAASSKTNPLGMAMDASTSVGPMLPHGHGLTTYGQLVPPSYEDSIMYESAPLPLNSGQPLGAAASPLQPSTSGPLGDPPALAKYSHGSAGAGASTSTTPAPLTPPPMLQADSHTKLEYTLSPGATSPQGGPPAREFPNRPSQRDVQLSITVTNPVKREQAGMFGIKGSYITYQVSSQYTSPAMARSNTSVRRRFRDFVSLADVLKKRYRGYFIPPRPEKNAVEGQRMTDAFVEERRTALERYMNKLAAHPVLASCEELRTFLEAGGDLADSPQWRALQPMQQGNFVEGTAKLSKQLFGLERQVLDPVQAAQPTKKSADILRAIKETAQSMQVASYSDEELDLRRAREQLEVLKEQLLTASKAAEKLVHRMDRQSAVQGDLGLAMFKVAKAEEVEGAGLAQFTGTVKQHQQIGGDTKRFGTSLVRVSRVSRRATGKSAVELGTLHEFLGFMPAAVKGLSHREKQLLTANTLQADLEAKHRAIRDLEVAGAKVFGGDSAKQRKISELKEDVAKLELSIQAARAEYDKIKTSNHEELSRLRSDMKMDLVHMARMYSAVQAASSERALEVWLQLAGEMGATSEEINRAKLGSAAGRGAV